MQARRIRRCGALFASVKKLSAQLGEVLDGADHLAGVGVLVVVPGDDLNLRVAVRQGQEEAVAYLQP